MSSKSDRKDKSDNYNNSFKIAEELIKDALKKSPNDPK